MADTDIVARDFGNDVKNSSFAPWASFEANTVEEKQKLYTAISDSKKVADIVDQYFNLKDVAIETVEMVNEETGIVENQPRITLMTDKGESYSCISSVVFRDLQKIFTLFGYPSNWDKPLKVKVVEPRSNNNRRFFHLTF